LSLKEKIVDFDQASIFFLATGAKEKQGKRIKDKTIPILFKKKI